MSDLDPTLSKKMSLFARFSSSSKEEIYQQIMQLGRELAPFDSSWKVERNLVTGCQSMMYLKTIEREGLLIFYAHSDALISKGLAAIMIDVYSNQSPEWILTNKPTFLEELGIIGILTPTRSNGVLSLYQKMQKETFSFLQH